MRRGCEPRATGDVNCIILFLVGGPSHLDTWDFKPHAPDQVRGPFRPIQTNVPGIRDLRTFSPHGTHGRSLRHRPLGPSL